MERSKFGIPVTLLAAVLCLLGYYGGYVITGILVGYILLKEDSIALKKLSVKVIVAMLCFSVLSTLISLIPSVIGLVESLIRLFNDEFYMGNYYKFFDFFNSIVSLLRTVVFLLLGFHALSGKEFKIPVVDNLLNKYLK